MDSKEDHLFKPVPWFSLQDQIQGKRDLSWQHLPLDPWIVNWVEQHIANEARAQLPELEQLLSAGSQCTAAQPGCQTPLPPWRKNAVLLGLEADDTPVLEKEAQPAGDAQARSLALDSVSNDEFGSLDLVEWEKYIDAYLGGEVGLPPCPDSGAGNIAQDVEDDTSCSYGDNSDLLPPLVQVRRPVMDFHVTEGLADVVPVLTLPCISSRLEIVGPTLHIWCEGSRFPNPLGAMSQESDPADLTIGSSAQDAQAGVGHESVRTLLAAASEPDLEDIQGHDTGQCVPSHAYQGLETTANPSVLPHQAASADDLPDPNAYIGAGEPESAPIQGLNVGIVVPGFAPNATQEEETMNSKKKRSKSKRTIAGVALRFDGQDDRYTAYYRPPSAGDKAVFLGDYPTEADAKDAYNLVALMHEGIHAPVDLWPFTAERYAANLKTWEGRHHADMVCVLRLKGRGFLEDGVTPDYKNVVRRWANKRQVMKYEARVSYDVPTGDGGVKQKSISKTFDTPEEAAAYADKELVDHKGWLAWTNFPLSSYVTDLPLDYLPLSNQIRENRSYKRARGAIIS